MEQGRSRPVQTRDRAPAADETAIKIAVRRIGPALVFERLWEDTGWAWPRCPEKSPDQISGRLAKDGVAFISHERIYQHVWKDKKDGGALHLHLRHSGKKYNKRKGKNSGRGLIPPATKTFGSGH
jgi:hypothetical protein